MFCLACADPQICTQCRPGHTLNATDLGCYADTCSDPNCQFCWDPAVCISCKSQFFLEDPRQNCVRATCLAPNCLVCDPADTCLACAAPLTLFEGSCYSSACDDPNCALCAGAASCQRCRPGFSLRAGKCFSAACADPNCLSCVSPATCLACRPATPDFYLIGGQCFQALQVSQCGLCRYSNSCLSCRRGQTPEVCLADPCADADCLDPAGPCFNAAGVRQAFCNANYCSRAAVSLFTLAWNQTRLQRHLDCFDADCQVCLEPSVCDACASGFLLLRAVCVPDDADFNCRLPGACMSCPRLGAQTSSRACLSTPCQDPDCAECAGAQKCYACRPGFVRTRLGCVREFAAEPSCPDGTYALQGHCADCALLFPQCALCDATACLRCRPPFALSADACVYLPCPTPFCALCDGSARCVRCREEFFLDARRECQQRTLPAAVEHCLLHADERTCELCLPTFRPFRNGQVCVADGCQLPNCRECADGRTCLLCLRGFQLRGGRCRRHACAVANCLLCEPKNHCVRCQHPFVAGDGQCRSPKFCRDAGCLACAEPGVCDVCMPGLENRGGVCAQAHCRPANCRLCASDGQCSTCAEGFRADAEGACVPELVECPPSHFASADECLQCPADCLSCVSPGECTACRGGEAAAQGRCGPSGAQSDGPIVWQLVKDCARQNCVEDFAPTHVACEKCARSCSLEVRQVRYRTYAVASSQAQLDVGGDAVVRGAKVFGQNGTLTFDFSGSKLKQFRLGQLSKLTRTSNCFQGPDRHLELRLQVTLAEIEQTRSGSRIGLNTVCYLMNAACASLPLLYSFLQVVHWARAFFVVSDQPPPKFAAVGLQLLQANGHFQTSSPNQPSHYSRLYRFQN